MNRIAAVAAIAALVAIPTGLAIRDGLAAPAPTPAPRSTAAPTPSRSTGDPAIDHLLRTAHAVGDRLPDDPPDAASEAAVDALVTWAAAGGDLEFGTCLDRGGEWLFKLGGVSRLALEAAAPSPDDIHVVAVLHLSRELRRHRVLETSIGLTIYRDALVWLEARHLRPGPAFAMTSPALDAPLGFIERDVACAADTVAEYNAAQPVATEADRRAMDPTLVEVRRRADDVLRGVRARAGDRAALVAYAAETQLRLDRDAGVAEAFNISSGAAAIMMPFLLAPAYWTKLLAKRDEAIALLARLSAP